MKTKQKDETIFRLVLLTVLLAGLAVLAMSRIVFASRDDLDQPSTVAVTTNKDASDKAAISIEAVPAEKEPKKDELKPDITIVSSTLKGEAVVIGFVKQAQKVEYLLIKEGSVEPEIYLGKGKPADKNRNKWSLDYDFSNIPNGSYKIYADIKNEYGTYASNSTRVKVRNRKAIVSDQEITVDAKVPGGVVSSSSKKLKELREVEAAILDDSSLTKEEKQAQIELTSQQKEKIKKSFTFLQQAEQLLAQEEKGSLNDKEAQLIKVVRKNLETDSDADGLPDYEEERIGSDPFSADSDQDGYLDGDEVKNGYDPLKTSSEERIDKIVFQEPKDNGVESAFYRVEKVEMKKDENNPDDNGKIEISGKALPSSFITLYIYSDPIIVTVKTNENGDWTYTLDKELEDGNHEVYSAVTDNNGRITYKSKALTFVKTAQAIGDVQSSQAHRELELIRSPMQQQKIGIVIFVAVTSIFSMITALASIALLFRRHKDGLEN